MKKGRVAIVRVTEQRLDEALQESIGLLGGLEQIVPRGSRVLVKPNFTIAPTDRGITHPELVEAVVRMTSEASPREIVIAEGSGDTYTSQSFRFQAMYRIAARYGARLVDLNLEEGVKTPVPQGLGRPYVVLPKAVVDADVFISLPVFKVWGESPLSLSLKNLIGLYGARYYGYNKDSDSGAKQIPSYGLPGEVGTELGAHKPSLAKSICALNSAVETDLAIIDALEGSDGVGHWIRLDTLIAGRNPVATDAVAMAMAGYKASEHPTFRLCAERGIGPCELDQIDVVGERLEDASFPLRRLQDNILELPVEFCLNLLSTDELLQIHRALKLYDFLPDDAHPPAKRKNLLDSLTTILQTDGYFEGALGKCSDYAIKLMALIIDRGGTSGDLENIRNAFTGESGGQESLYYAPAARTLGRLGLVYFVDSYYRNYCLLPEGAVEAFSRLSLQG